jgi:hypothetical protein
LFLSPNLLIFLVKNGWNLSALSCYKSLPWDKSTSILLWLLWPSATLIFWDLRKFAPGEYSPNRKLRRATTFCLHKQTYHPRDHLLVPFCPMCVCENVKHFFPPLWSWWNFQVTLAFDSRKKCWETVGFMARIPTRREQASRKIVRARRKARLYNRKNVFLFRARKATADLWGQKGSAACGGQFNGVFMSIIKRA